MNEKPKSKWYWRLLRWGLIVLAVLVTLVAVLVTEENWRGKRAWENYKRQAQARGEQFDWKSVIPAKIPDDQNFLAAPGVMEALTNGQTFNIYRGDSQLWTMHGGNWQKGTYTDLREWQNYFQKLSASPSGKTNGFPIPAHAGTPAEDVLWALSVYDAPLAALRTASLRPDVQLPGDFANGFVDVDALLPELAAEKRTAQFLQLRILAELQANEPGPALTDTKLLLRFMDSLRAQPFLISHLVALAMQTIAMQPIYEGLARHCWDDVQLADLQSALAAKDSLADFQFAMRGERTCAIAEFEAQRRTRQMKSVAEADGHDVVVTNSLWWMPSTYFYQNQLAFARMYEQLILPLVNVTDHTVSVAAYHSAETQVTNMMKHYSPYTVQALVVFPAVGRTCQKFAMAQAQLDLARTACALERYRLAHREYPTALEALAPQFIPAIPHDVINGQPLHYRRTDDGKFVLYSVGWDEKDDGGEVVLNKEGRADWRQGNWVWKY
ncbi:MAG TPA: hypothetical protein VF988_00980 [Verrucomicrobiae bacterium]